MKATITVEVPDYFEKGDCENCPLELWSEESILDVKCYAYRYNCPLEIQRKADESNI